MPEERRVLLEKDADAAKHDVMLADVRLVGPCRRVDRRQHDVVPARHERGRKRVVAQAAPAVRAWPAPPVNDKILNNFTSRLWAASTVLILV